MNLKSGIIRKGIKTSIVSFLEDIRVLMSQYPNIVPSTVMESKFLESEAMVKYI
jgi:hypothetical protein